MHRNRSRLLGPTTISRAGATLAALVVVLGSPAFGQVWWNNFPRIVGNASLSQAQSYGANAVMNGVANDPSWGLWFSYGNDDGASDSSTRASFQAAGIVSLSYNEGYGQVACPIDELKWNASQQRWNTAHQFWSWDSYSGGPIVWTGAWCWFDSFTNDLPANQSELSYFARPYTRMNPVYGGGPMLYPDGTPATGWLNEDTTATNPCDSRVFDAGCSKSIYGSVLGDTSWNFNSLADQANQTHNGELWIAASGAYTGEAKIGKDTACPCWTNYVHAEILAAAALTGAHGTWTDNFSCWDSFMSGSPVNCAFGNWSVALFQNYLTNRFSSNQLAAWRVLATNATLSAITNFNVCSYLLTTASNTFKLTGTNLSSSAWVNTGWETNPVWSAYKIFRRRNGSAALSNYDQIVHAAAAQAGQTNFALLVNDQLPAMGGWARGTLDLASTELSLGWNLTAGSRGLGLPPFGRVSPVYKAVVEQGRSQFANIWLYNDGYASQATNAGPTLALFYEMLAADTTPLFTLGDSEFWGTQQMQSNFMSFVAHTAAPALAGREPVQEVGIYLSTSTIMARMLPGDAENFNQQYHQYAVWGWGTALSQLHYQYRIVPEWKLNFSDLLPALKVLIIPNAEAFEPTDVPTLQAWVTNGGCLLVTGDSGSLLGESGNFAPTNAYLLSALTGVTNLTHAPAQTTNFFGSGVVYYYSNNLGYVYYNDTASQRASLLGSFGTALTNAYAFLQTQPVLNSSNAPTTVGLTLYQNPAASKTIVDLNNFNVGTNPPFAMTPTPVTEVDLARPSWLTNGLTASATTISPDGSLTVSSLGLNGNRLVMQLPSVTNYLSVVLQPTPAPPGVAIVPVSTNIVLGANVTFTALPAGTAPFVYYWLDNHGAVIPGATSASLTLTNPPVAAAGNYTVVVSNQLGSVTNSASLAIAPLVFLSVASSPSGFVFKTGCPSGNTCRVWATTNLALPFSNWMPAVTGTFSSGQFWFTDSLATNLPQRFYRSGVP